MVMAVEAVMMAMEVVMMAMEVMMAMVMMAMVAVMSGPGATGCQSNRCNGEHGSGRNNKVTKHGGVSSRFAFGVRSTPVS